MPRDLDCQVSTKSHVCCLFSIERHRKHAIRSQEPQQSSKVGSKLFIDLNVFIQRLRL